jgi:hypothetical protein
MSRQMGRYGTVRKNDFGDPAYPGFPSICYTNPTSVMPSRAPNTTAMNPDTARYGNLNASTTATSKATNKI